MKEQFYSPEKMRAPGEIVIPNIPVNQYQRTVSDALKDEGYTPADMLRIYRDMAYIREFETMLMSIRLKKTYSGVDYSYIGPAHSSIGQEAAAVGQSYLLNENDLVFGGHRSHGEVIAKGLSAIEKMSDEQLMQVMETTFDGKLYAVVKQYLPKENIRDQARVFFLYGLICELFGRENGFARGLGNSMHLFFLPFGLYPSNAIVAASYAIATGAALYKREAGAPGVCIANGGDGSMGCGISWESFNFASMAQLNELWDEDFKGGLPVMFNFVNNGYAMGDKTNGDTMALGELARAGAGINPDAMHAERIDGMNPLAVIDAYRRKLPILREGKGPVLLDVVTYRYGNHSTADPTTYRMQEEIEAWKEHDCLKNFRAQMLEAGICCDEDLDRIAAEIKTEILDVVKLAIDYDLSPRLDLANDPDAVARFTFNNGRQEKMADWPLRVIGEKSENSRVQRNSKKSRYAFENGKPVSALKQYSLRDAIFDAIIDKFYEDPTLISYGEDCRDWGGAFGVYQGLFESLPHHRLFNAPISESCIVSSAVGYAMCGGRCIVELMYCDFFGRAGDDVLNQLAKWQAMSAGQLKLPVVLRVSVGRKYGAQHSQDWSALTSHVPGLKVVFPATPYDAKGLMTAVLNGTDPVVFFESQALYDIGEQFHTEGVPTESYEIKIGDPDIKRAGSDVTILTIGATLYKAMDAAKILSEKYGIEAEVIDLRSLVPLDYTKLLESVKKTGRVVLVSDACVRGSQLNDVAQHITSMAFDDLDAPPVVLGARNWVSPCPELEDYYFPSEGWIIDAIHEKLFPIPGHTPGCNFTEQEELRLEQFGL